MQNLLRLVKPEEKQEIQIVEESKLKTEIVNSIISGQCTIPEDIVNTFGIDYDKVISLFSDPNFTNLLAQSSQAKLKMSFYGKDLNRLEKIIESDDDKVAIQGIKLKAQLTQAVKSFSINETNNFVFNLENMVKETEKQTNPVFDVESRKVN